ncbi:unnamed protein product [[Candida] boidinii]|nr:unnamed protein product [[Candida] boidinii]
MNLQQQQQQQQQQQPQQLTPQLNTDINNQLNQLLMSLSQVNINKPDLVPEDQSLISNIPLLQQSLQQQLPPFSQLQSPLPLNPYMNQHNTFTNGSNLDLGLTSSFNNGGWGNQTNGVSGVSGISTTSNNIVIPSNLSLAQSNQSIATPTVPGPIDTRLGTPVVGNVIANTNSVSNDNLSIPNLSTSSLSFDPITQLGLLNHSSNNNIPVIGGSNTSPNNNVNNQNNNFWGISLNDANGIMGTDFNNTSNNASPGRNYMNTNDMIVGNNISNSINNQNTEVIESNIGSSTRNTSIWSPLSFANNATNLISNQLPIGGIANTDLNKSSTGVVNSEFWSTNPNVSTSVLNTPTNKNILPILIMAIMLHLMVGFQQQQQRQQQIIII